jgi:hypothetical protein
LAVKHRIGRPETYRNSIEGVIPCHLGVISHGLNYLGLHPPTSYDFQSKLLLFELHDFPFKLHFYGEIESLNFNRIL